MPHHIYHTEGIVLSGTNVGEANKFLTIFTKELGLISAHAQGIRKITSKLRYSLQDFSYVQVDLVKGRDLWRVTTAKEIPLISRIKNDQHALLILGNFSRFFKRLVNGEEENQELFATFLEVLSYIEENILTVLELKSIEIIFVLRALFLLGYMTSGEAMEKFLDDPLSSQLLALADAKKSELVAIINQSLRETQL
jgi:DNA repair protein RecO (recombination protein O)